MKKKFQFYSDEIKLSSLQSRCILEQGNKLFGFLFDALKYLDTSKEAKELRNFIQFYLADHIELKEAIDLW
jgi:hypothetical protein